MRRAAFSLTSIVGEKVDGAGAKNLWKKKGADRAVQLKMMSLKAMQIGRRAVERCARQQLGCMIAVRRTPPQPHCTVRTVAPLTTIRRRSVHSSTSLLTDTPPTPLDETYGDDYMKGILSKGKTIAMVGVSLCDFGSTFLLLQGCGTPLPSSRWPYHLRPQTAVSSELQMTLLICTCNGAPPLKLFTPLRTCTFNN
jgi:hypothetical protein